MDDEEDLLTDWFLPHDILLSGREIGLPEQVKKFTMENDGPSATMTSSSVRSNGRVIVHIDIDCFYAQVEMIHNPDCKHKPVGVQQKYLLVTCNYKARECGVTKMMGVKEAKKKCPDLVIFNGEDLTQYRDMSYKITDHFRTYSPLVERLGFDENFIDVTQMVDERISKDNSITNIKGHLYGQESSIHTTCNSSHQRLAIGSEIAWELRQSLCETLGITCCAGVASNKLLAKLVAGTHKPNQQTTLLPEYTDDLMMSLQQCSDIPGIGHSTSAKLDALGIQSIADLRQCDEQALVRAFGDVLTRRMKQLSYGDDPLPVIASGKPQSLSEEDSFKKCSTVDDVKRRLTDIANKLLIRLLADGRIPQTVKLSVRKYNPSVNKYTSRESRQCPVPSHLFTTFDKETVSRTSSLLCDVVWPLFSKLVNVNQPFHITLLNLCFAKLVKNTSGIISALIENMSQNQRKKNTFYGLHSDTCTLQEKRVLINVSQSDMSEGFSSECELDSTCYVSDSQTIEPLSLSSRKRTHQCQDRTQEVKHPSLNHRGVCGDKFNVSICETEQTLYRGSCTEKKNSLSGYDSLREADLSYAHIQSDDIDMSIVSELPGEIQCSIFQEYADRNCDISETSIHLPNTSSSESDQSNKSILPSEKSVLQTEITKNRMVDDSCVDRLSPASTSVLFPKDNGTMILSNTQTPSSQSTPSGSLSTGMVSSPTRITSKHQTSLQKSPIPPDVDKSVFYQLPKDVQREMLAQWRWSVGASLSPSSRVQQHSKSKKTDSILSYMRKS